MFKSLQSRLLILFLLISLSSIIIVSVAIQWGFTDSFDDYLQQKREEQVDQLRQRLVEEYEANGRMNGELAGSLIHLQAMTDYLYYKIYDQQGRLIIDSTPLIKMMEHMMINGMMMESSAELESFDLLVEEYPVQWNDNTIAQLEVYFFKGYTQGDFYFFERFNRNILLAAVVMILLGILFSILFTRRITMGLREMEEAARSLQQHDLTVRIPTENQSEEMKQLALAINELAESLQYQESLRKQFTDDLAHELRTPLATLRSQLEAFQDGVWEPTPERLKQSHHELMRLVGLVNEMDTLLAAENPQIQLQKESFSVQALLQNIYEHFFPAFYEREVQLILKPPAPTLQVTVDRDRFMQIMMNIMDNALKYTGAGGKVKLSAQQTGEMIRFQIEDTGQGIAAEDLPHLFERFYRGEKSRNRKTGGAGIGLSVVHALMKAHHGEISIKSEVGVGTVVRLDFPV